jgi:hypothetical protein
MKKKAKKATAGERIASRFIVNRVGGRDGNKVLAEKINRAIRAERGRCLDVLDGMMREVSPSSAAYDTLWKAYYYMA